ncbi:hypothetical protein B0T18DRAFT_407973 [Schizothecium vesticola]|uniref:Uncharacterized protein n=1 Tax=Schizothecium vesticola TaxID=314040 RepID=A0AA40F308_9PEZI|nr:hypothetical protein B0T18DRAFT_407973 [Schizothecium vesticola]
MGIIKKTFYTGVLTGASVLGYLGATTTLITPLPNDDPVWRSKSYARVNVHRNAAMHDVAVKRIPLDKIKPSLLQKDGDLTLEFCRSVWGGLGYRFQRNYLARKYQGAATAKQLWTAQQLRESTYERGTQLTDHFEVIEKTKAEIVVRCGDSPRNAGPRPSDGLFIIGTHVDKARGEVVLELKSVFFDSSRKTEGIHSSVPSWIEYPHRWYSRLLLETASWNLTR